MMKYLPEKFYIEIPNEAVSRAVQNEFFAREVYWSDGDKKYFKSDRRYLAYSGNSFYKVSEGDLNYIESQKIELIEFLSTPFAPKEKKLELAGVTLVESNGVIKAEYKGESTCFPAEELATIAAAIKNKDWKASLGSKSVYVPTPELAKVIKDFLLTLGWVDNGYNRNKKYIQTGIYSFGSYNIPCGTEVIIESFVEIPAVAKIRLNERYEAEVTRENVKVGCRTFSHEEVWRAAEFFLKS